LSQALCLSALLPLSACGFFGESEEEFVARQMSYMVFVEGGEFMMGNPGGWDVDRDSWPPVKVRLSDFYIQKYEVTEKDFQQFIAFSGWEIHDPESYERLKNRHPDRFNPELPAVASWKAAHAFCGWLGLKTDRSVGLPTEAQWEYAARSKGQLVRYATDDGTLRPGENINEGSDWGMSAPSAKLPRSAGSYAPNPLGLYDMSGNVSEWVRDHYSSNAYKDLADRDPLGPEIGEKTLDGKLLRPSRGGNFADLTGSATVVRIPATETYWAKEFGFRCENVGFNNVHKSAPGTG